LPSTQARQTHRQRAASYPVLGDLRVGVADGGRGADGHCGEPSSLCGAQALGAESDAVSTRSVSRVGDERPQDAPPGDIRGQLVTVGVGEPGAWVAWILVDQVDGDLQRFAGRDRFLIEQVSLNRMGRLGTLTFE